jgi:hypothetical protein
VTSPRCVASIPYTSSIKVRITRVSSRMCRSVCFHASKLKLDYVDSNDNDHAYVLMRIYAAYTLIFS